MSLGYTVRRTVRIAGVAGGMALTAIALAQSPKPPIVPVSGSGQSGRLVPPADTLEPIPPPRPVAKVSGSTSPVNAELAFPQMLADARSAYSKVRDYTCHLVRQEKINGKLQPEQTCELRVRTQPFSVNLRVMAPKEVSGQETSYLSSKSTSKVRFKAAGVEGIKHGFRSLALDDPKTLGHTRHPVTDTGLAATLDRVERAVAVEKRMNHPVQVLVAEYTFAGRPCTRYEIFAERPHTHRYAYRCVLYIDHETKLPIRFEAYDQPRPGGPSGGEVLEVHSFVGVRLNAGLGEAAFDR
jgi:hypothetical protein